MSRTESGLFNAATAADKLLTPWDTERFNDLEAKLYEIILPFASPTFIAHPHLILQAARMMAEAIEHPNVKYADEAWNRLVGPKRVKEDLARFVLLGRKLADHISALNRDTLIAIDSNPLLVNYGSVLDLALNIERFTAGIETLSIPIVSGIRAPAPNTSRRMERAKRVTDAAVATYEFVAERKATRITERVAPKNPRQRETSKGTGPALQFLRDVFEVAGIKASAPAQLRRCLETRNGGQPAVRTLYGAPHGKNSVKTP